MKIYSCKIVIRRKVVKSGKPVYVEIKELDEVMEKTTEVYQKIGKVPKVGDNISGHIIKDKQSDSRHIILIV